MNKTELVDAIADDTGMTKADARAALEALTGAVQKQLEQGQEVAIAGFGKFTVSQRAARSGRNPHTGESIQIKASKTPKFSAAAGLKAAVNGSS